MTKSYTSAFFIAGLLQVLGWAVIVIGAIGVFNLPGSVNGFGTFAALVATTLTGILLLATAQMMLAVLDTACNTENTANNSAKALQVLEKIASTSSAVAARASAPAPTLQPAPIQTGSAEVTEVVGHNGYRIITDSHGNITCDGRKFASVIEAKDWIDKFTNR